MTWERFGYICRRVEGIIKEEESVDSCIARVEKEASCNLYGSKFNNNELPKKILNDITQVSNKELSLNMLKAYGKLDLASSLEQPLQLKRVTIYLSYITFVFFIVSSIYQVKVAPSFIAAFETFEIPIPEYILFYQNYWYYIVILILIFLILSIIIGYTLKNLFQFKVGSEKGLVFRFLTFRGIRKAYLNILTILSFPASLSLEDENRNQTEIETHLSEIMKSNMSLPLEMEKLVGIEKQTLVSLCEKQMRFISVTVALLIIGVIYLFLSSAYSPIFVLGETV